MRGGTRFVTGVLLLALVGMGPAGAVTGGSAGGATATSVGASTTAETSAADAALQDPCNYESLYDETVSSIVTIQVMAPQGQGLGTGFVYDGEGHIVTNQHVVGDSEQVDVQFNRGEWRTADVVGTDAYSDLAVLEVNDTPDYVDQLDLSAQAPEQGQPVAAFGSPLGLEGTITNGIVSGTNRSLPAGSQQGPRFTIPNTVQTTAAINPGNSGGPLVNCQGQVLGVNTATAAGGENVGFAIPASRVGRVVPALIQNGSYAHSFLGITYLDVSPTIADANNLSVNRGVLIRNVVPGSPADGVLQGDQGTVQENGLTVPAGGDVILAIGGQQIDSGEELSSFLTQTRPGETVTMTILRDGERMQVEVTLGERPPPGEGV